MCGVWGSPSSGECFTFAVIGRDEAATLAGVLSEARAALHPGDRVCFVDSASADDSAAIAHGLGVEVLSAPVGKGNAIAVALERCETRYLCSLDADLFQWETNIPAALRSATVETRAEMVVAAFTDGRRRVIMPAIYWPLVDALVPEYGRRCDPTPLSGIRVLDTTVPIGPFPGGYGVETHLNLSFALAGRRIAITDVGDLRGPLRGYTNIAEMAQAVAAAILDFAVVTGRLPSDLRPAWERWTDRVIGVIAGQPPPGAPDEDFLATLHSTVAEPFLPARGHDAARLLPLPGG
jgi:glucosyl-3-phosphoglycerate synthase